MEKRICKCCGRELPIDQFMKNALGVSHVCKDCAAEKKRKKREETRRLKQQAVDAINARNLRLNDFTPRELMTELKRRGYEFTITYTETHTITSESF